MKPDCDFAFMFILYRKKEIHTFYFYEKEHFWEDKTSQTGSKQHRRVANI